MNLSTYIGGIVQAKAYRILRAHVYSCLEKHTLNPTSWSLLGLAHDTPNGIRPADAARILGVKAPLITAMADELLAGDLVERKADPLDQRAKLLTITSQGRQLVDEVEQDLSAHLRHLLKGVTTAELGVYHKVLKTIISNDADMLA